MADDVTALMDHLGIEQADLMGYSMGGGIAASQIARNPHRFTAAILSGVGDAIIEGNAARMSSIAEGMEAKDPDALMDPTARGFRAFAERSGNDLGALAALQRSGRRISDPEGLSKVSIPVMVLVGKDDELASNCKRLVATIPGARHVVVPGDHLSVFQYPEFKEAVLAFLGQVAPV
jgi:pimeloyl-ACP methyl ester carboxylesterase